MLIQLHLDTTVPLIILGILSGERQWPDPEQRERLAQTIARHGDSILYRTKHTAMAVNALSQAVAAMAFVPGGIRIFDRHYEVPRDEAEAFFHDLYGDQAPHLLPQKEDFQPVTQLDFFQTHANVHSRIS